MIIKLADLDYSGLKDHFKHVWEEPKKAPVAVKKTIKNSIKKIGPCAVGAGLVGGLGVAAYLKNKNKDKK